MGDPRTLWEWFEEFLKDPEARAAAKRCCPQARRARKLTRAVHAQELAPSPNGKTVTIGLFVRELLLDQFYFETIFPRIPEQVSRQMKEGLSRLGFATAALGSAGLGGNRRGGGDGESRRPPSVKAALSVSLGQRAPHVTGGREDGRGLANVDPGRERRQREEREREERGGAAAAGAAAGGVGGGGGAARRSPPRSCR